MKKQFLFAALAVATLFTACSKEEELNQNNGTTPVNFVIGGVGSRTTTDANYATTFDANDEIGIFSSALTSDMSNVKFTVSSDKTTLTGEGTYTFNGETEATFYAYYPYSSTTTNKDAVSFSVVVDQTTNLGKNDFVVAKTTATSENSTVTLNFSHKMSFVELLFGTNLSALNVKSVTMHSCKNGATYNFTSETVTAIDGDVDVTMYNASTNSTTKFWAIVPPQEIESGKLFTIVTESGREFTYTPSIKETFTSDNIRRIILEIGTGNDDTETVSPVFSLSSVSIAGWGNVGQITEENKDVVLSDITATNVVSGNSVDLSLLTVADSWGYVGGTAEYSSEEEAMKFTGLTAGNTYWSTNSLFYCYSTNFTVTAGKTYTLSMKVKNALSESVPTNFMYFIADSASKFYKLSDNDTDSGTINTTQTANFTSLTADSNGYYTVTCKTVSLDSYAETCNTNQTSQVNSAATAKLVVGFRLSNVNLACYVKDVTLTEND